VAETPLEQIGTRKLPGAMFGRTAPSVTAAEQYADTRTYWVEPATGAVVGLEETLLQQFRHGGKVVPAISAHLVSPRPDDELLGQVRQGAVVLPWLRWRASAVLTVTGLGLLALAAYRSRREPARRSTSRSASRWASAMRPSP
jgi:hypothetical protein